jgi:hypothetical protein
MVVFWVVTLCSLIEVPDVPDVLAASIIALMIEAANSSEMSVNSTRQLGATTQKTDILILAVVRT